MTTFVIHELETKVPHAAQVLVLREKPTELEQTQIEMLERLAAVEAHDTLTGNHSKRVGALASGLARQMGWDDARVEMIRLAALLHDIGKISIPNHILRKRQQLSAQEAQIMRAHPLTGARMLAQGTSQLMRMAKTIALSHHECWDGSGYPYQLAGEQIPLPSRIVAVADAYDAMMSERPYKRAYTRCRALDEAQRCAGTQFDPNVVAALVHWVKAEPSEALAA